MSFASRMGYEPERSQAAASVPVSYAVVGSLFTHPIRILVLQNQTNAGVSFSLDGVNTFITLQAGISIVIDITAARTNDPAGLSEPIGHGIYARYEVGAPTTGSIYATAIYGAGSSPL